MLTRNRTLVARRDGSCAETATTCGLRDVFPLASMNRVTELNAHRALLIIDDERRYGFNEPRHAVIRER